MYLRLDLRLFAARSAAGEREARGSGRARNVRQRANAKREGGRGKGGRAKRAALVLINSDVFFLEIVSMTKTQM